MRSLHAMISFLYPSFHLGQISFRLFQQTKHFCWVNRWDIQIQLFLIINADIVTTYLPCTLPALVIVCYSLVSWIIALKNLDFSPTTGCFPYPSTRIFRIIWFQDNLTSEMFLNSWHVKMVIYLSPLRFFSS